MYLSQLVLEPRDQNARRHIARPYELHRTLQRALPPQSGERVLFRVDSDTPARPVVLVQSQSEPNWSEPVFRGRWLAEPPNTKIFDPPLQPKLAQGQVLRFRLRGNPTADRRLNPSDANTRRVGLWTEPEQLQWLLRKFEAAGCEVRDLPEAIAEKRPCRNLVVIPEGRIVTGKKISDVEASGVAAARFEGHLKVIDVERFCTALVNGIGRSKAFGFGLLSIAPVVA